jgi:threonine dehydrogenase-like Zn-dependent dehydrogenase
VVDDSAALVLPEELPGPRATLIPNLETALNAVWDAELRGDEKVVIVGAGPVGLLVSFVLARLHDGRPVMVDREVRRREQALALPWITRTRAPVDVEPGAADLVFHASGSPAGLQVGLDAVGFEGRVIDLSWYGEKPVSLDLGTHFHFQRKQIRASQVGAIAPSHRQSHSRADRLRAVLELLADPDLDQLLDPPVPFAEMPRFMSGLYRGETSRLAPVIEYP